MTAAQTGERFFGWRMVALAFVAYNFGLTVVINVFAPAMPVLERELGASRSAVSMAFGLLMLSMGVLASVVGNLTLRFTLRSLMMTGAALHSVGFLLLAFANHLTVVVLLYGVLHGAAICLMASISAPTLISRWFEYDRGKALSVGLVQVFALVTAPFAAWLLATGGRPLLFLSLAGLFAALVPVMYLVIDRPDSVGQSPRRAPQLQDRPPSTAALLGTRDIFKDRRFWLLSLSVAIFTSAGITFASHGPAMAASKGVTMTLAATVLSATGAGTLLGALGFGWVIDKFGPFRALTAALALTTALWGMYSLAPSLPLMVATAFCLGACMGPTAALNSACVNELFGPANFSRVVGYGYLVRIPFMFAPAPVAGRLFDLSGGYGSTYLVLLTVMVVAILLSLLLVFEAKRVRVVHSASAMAE